ncbi:MAG: lysophospholipid acyltransferase family protein [Gemmatimonadaceae bacterium]
MPIVRTALRWYYRSIAVAGRSRVPITGPVFLAVNHPNALVDALVVAAVMPRRVHFTAKATIFANPAVGAFLRAGGAIPLKRAADEAKKVATPAEAYSSDSKEKIAYESGAASQQIAPSTANAKSAIDPARNAESFRAVSEALAKGNAIVIFPEGKSHDDPHLAPLRTGLARMALLARDTFQVRGIKIVPVGLLFEQKEAPRSRILIQVGEAIDVDSVPTGTYAVESLMSMVSERLNAVTLNFESKEDAASIARVSETLAALLEPTIKITDGGPPLSSILALARRTDRVRQVLSGEVPIALRERAIEFQTRLDAFRAQLNREQIDATDLQIEVDATPGVRFAIRESMLAALLLPISWWGRITHFIPIRVARMLALRGAKNRDEPAMNTLVIGVVLVLLTYAVLTTAVGLLFGFWWALAFFITLIPSASSDLRYGDRVARLRKRMHAYLVFRERPDLRRELLGEADWLRREAGTIEQLTSDVVSVAQRTSLE